MGILKSPSAPSGKPQPKGLVVTSDMLGAWQAEVLGNTICLKRV